ncbi:MAG: RNA polymerase sigma factor [bacterium]
MDDDTRTMLKLKDGDRSAFDELYNRFKIRVYNYILRSLGNVYMAEDLTQEVFVRMYIYAKNYEPTAKFSTWLFTIATNLIINEYHKMHDTELVESDNVQDGKPSIEEDIIQKDTEHRLLELINKLPKNQRAAIILRSYEGMDYQEIATVLKVSEKAVKSLLSRARERLLDGSKKFNL